jgi:type II secretory pathway pseudopilin PulG
MSLLVTVSIMAILAAVVVPQLPELSQVFGRMNAQANLLQDLKRAQAESITQGCRGVFVIAADKTSYTFGCDYLPYDTAATPHSDVIRLVRRLPKHITIEVPSPIIFNSHGQTVDTYGIISNLIITLSDSSHGTAEDFASGTLLGTGVFSYN